MNNCKIFISTSNSYHRCLLPFAYLFNKFWSNKQEVVFLGYDKPKFNLPPNFSFKSLGVQRGPKYYSEDLRNFFQSIDDQYFIYTMEDQFILDYVDLNLIENFISYIVNDPKIGRICLTNSIFQTVLNHPAHVGKKHEHYKDDLIKLTSDSNWKITCEWSLWNKNYFIKYLQGNLTPWEFEQQSFSLAKNDGYNIVGKNKVAIRHAEAVRRGKVNENFDFRFVNENQELDNKIKKELNQYLKKT